MTTNQKSKANSPSDLYIPRSSFKIGTTYIGSKNDVRHLIGIGKEFAPHNSTTDKTWVAYELLSPELKNHTGQRRGFSERGLPIYCCSLTGFRLWARKVAVITEGSSAIQ